MEGLTSLVAVLLLAASPVTIAQPPREPVALDAAATHRAAVAHAPVARLLEAESRALCCGLDPQDPEAGAQVGLIQTTLAHLADHQRNLAAEEALSTYFQIISLQRRAALLDEAERLIEQLARTAQRASELGVPDGNPLEIEARGLELADRRLELEGGLERLRLRLASALGRTPAEAPRLELSESLEIRSDPIDADEAVRQGLQTRSDLAALRALCRCTNEQSLPAARRLLGVLQPGLGLAPQTAPPTLLARLAAGHSRDRSDLACRRQQCQALLAVREDQIRDQILDASVQLRFAYRRAELANQQVELTTRRISRAERATELGQAASGATSQAQLDRLEARSTYYERLVEARQAELRWNAAQGLLARP